MSRPADFTATLALAVRMLLRDWRAGELRVLAAALVVAVASVTSVAFFADRVSQALVRDAHQLLGADLVMVSDHAWDPSMRSAIVARGLRDAEAWNFISMVRSAEAPAAERPTAVASAVAPTNFRTAFMTSSSPRDVVTWDVAIGALLVSRIGNSG